jgi:hypothetical protein
VTTAIMTTAPGPYLAEIRRLRTELETARADYRRLAAMLAAHLAADATDAAAALWRTYARESYDAGCSDAAAALAAAWPAWPPLAALDGPTLAELELRRWGPGGRESHFTDHAGTDTDL